MPTTPSKHLETFPNPDPGRDYTIEIRIPEFTCLCPKTGQPDFATLYLDYVPDQRCVELKALKLYIWSFRDEGAFHEAVTNTILNDLVSATAPRFMRLRAEFNVRGGLYTAVTVDYRMPGWTPPGPVPKPLPERAVVDTPPPSDSAQVLAPVTASLSPPTPPAPEPPAAAPEVKPESSPPRPWERGARQPEAKPAEPASRGLAQQRKLPESLRPPAPRGAEVKPTEAKAPVPSKPAVTPPAPKKKPEPVFLGIDLGSAGCRLCAIDEQRRIVATARTPLPPAIKRGAEISQDPALWWQAVSAGLHELFKTVAPERVRRIAVDGTSGTLLLCGRDGTPITDAILYNDGRALAQAERIAAYAVRHSGAHGVGSALAKLLWFHDKNLHRNAAFAAHPADWIVGKLTGRWGQSDYNNCLKLGYNAEAMRWPEWLAALDINMELLPTVHASGEHVAAIGAECARAFGLSPDCEVMAGTTDGVASFLAAGGQRPGHAVTSLGSTLVLKLLSDKPVFAPEHGVYSHRLGRYWLAGGASNSGGAVLLQYFDVEQMEEMTPLIDPEHFTGLDYYPLLDIGERFPHNDPKKTAVLEPLPNDSVTFFQGLLEGIARIEAQGYELLQQLGAPAISEVRTTGGGARNPAWQRLRERILGVPLKKPVSDQAAYGSALLAAGLIDKSLLSESESRAAQVL
ncbi:MAG: NADPH-dependent 7-cyano-7-deazaguanine reductase QueF [Gammaproteobacteria bacterium]|nr:NADPH-dependent 7-cyano-7-deazaguanine reductase QueF [Gammaproteobacteria bacterium]